MDDLDIDGKWYLPGIPEHRAHGKLTSDGRGLALSLTEPLEPLSDAEASRVWPRERSEHPLVWGVGYDGELVTLLDVTGHNLAAEMELSSAVENHQPTFVVVGDHLQSDRIEFGQIMFEHLLAWVHPPPPYSEDDTSFTINTGTEVLGEAALPNGDTIALETGVTGSWGGPATRADQWCAMHVDCAQPIGISDFVTDRIRPLQDLLSLLLGMSVRIESFQVRAEDGDPRTSLSVHFDALQVDTSREVSAAALHSYTSPMIASWNELTQAAPFDKLIDTWFGMHRTHRTCIALLLSVLYREGLYVEHRFLTAFQSAERFAKHSYSGRQKKPEEHARRVADIIDAATAAGVDQEDIGWAERILQSRNDRPLVDLITEMLDDSGPAGQALRDADPAFSRTVCSDRGGRSHGSGSSRIGPEARYWYSEGLRWLVRAHMLIDLGMSAELVWRKVTTRAGFKHACESIADARGS